jgi:hypothetical protein
VTRRALLVLLVLGGCTKDNPAFDEPTSTGPAGPATTTTSPTTAATPTTAPDETTSGVTVAIGTTAPDPTTPGTTTTTTPPDITTDTTVDTTIDTTADATTSDPRAEETLIAHDPGGCKLPFWCINGQPDNPYPSRVWAQACFHPTLEPPYAVRRVRYLVYDVLGDPADAFLEVREMDSGRPADGGPIDSHALSPAELEPGPHEIDLPDPKKIDSDGVCVGLVGGGMQTSLGVAIDPSSKPPDQSYIRVGGPCDLDEWADIMDLPVAQEEWRGAWCIDADIVQLDD